MLLVRVMPCLLLNDGRLVKTLKFKNPSYIGDPINAVRIYNELEVDELIFLDITATLEKREPQFPIITDIANECFMPFAYGGGIREIEDIKKIFKIGVEKVVINTYAFENPSFVKKSSDFFGSQSIIVSVDVKKNFFGKYEVYVEGGRRSTGKDPIIYAKEMEKMGAGEIFLNSIDRDGTWEGYDTQLIKQVSSTLTIPVIVCGGAGTINDFKEAIKNGASAVAAGSLFVYQAKDLGVLINFPTREELRPILR